MREHRRRLLAELAGLDEEDQLREALEAGGGAAGGAAGAGVGAGGGAANSRDAEVA